MNIPRRIKLLSAAAALSLTSLTGLIAAAPAHALTIPPHGPTYHTWWLPVSLNPSPGSSCKTFTLTGYSGQFAGVGDTSVNVELYENTNYGWTELEVPGSASIPVDSSTGTLLYPNSVTWTGSLPYPEFGTGQYQAWLTDGAGRGGATPVVTCM
jgi:hypothetical protein